MFPQARGSEPASTTGGIVKNHPSANPFKQTIIKKQGRALASAIHPCFFLGRLLGF